MSEENETESLTQTDDAVPDNAVDETEATPQRRMTRRALGTVVGSLALAAAAGGSAGCTRLTESRVGKRFLPMRRGGANDEQPRVTNEPTPASLTARAATVRFLNRVAFGPTPDEIQQIESGGRAAYIAEQLKASGDDDNEPLGLRMRLRNIDALRYTAWDMRDFKEDEVLRQLQQAAILRAVYSPWQVRERMADFWTNHFNVYGRKAHATWMKAHDEREVVRRHALGNFPAMLTASAHSPAMLAYLDNKLNRAGVANENYAREIMELHAMGVAGTRRNDGTGGYTQKDVQEVARCFTGWTIEEGFLKRKGTFLFQADLHDKGEKRVLGHRIPAGGGKEDGDRVLAILGDHDSTAHFIAGKIVRYFLGEDAPNGRALVTRLADIYMKSKPRGDIGAMLQPLLTSDDLLLSPPLLKRPFDYVVSALRVANADTDASLPLQGYLAKMGQPLYQWPMPDGYPDATQAWTGTLLHRWNFALALASGGIEGTRAHWLTESNENDVLRGQANLGKLSRAVLQEDNPKPNITRALSKLTDTNEIAAMLLCTPAFQAR